MSESDSIAEIFFEHLEASMRSCFRVFVLLIKFVISERDGCNGKLIHIEDTLKANTRLLKLIEMKFAEKDDLSCVSLPSSGDSFIWEP